MALFFPPRSVLPLLVLCLVFLPLAAFLLRNVCGLCRIELPSWPRALIAVVLVGPLAYLTFDLTGYAVAVAGSGAHWNEALSYKEWLRAPWPWKWEKMDPIPMLRVLPIVFTLSLAGILQVFILHVPFRLGVLVFAIHWAVNVAAFCLLSFLCNVAVGLLGVSVGPPLALGTSEPTAQTGKDAGTGRNAPATTQPTTPSGTTAPGKPPGDDPTDFKHPLSNIEDKVDTTKKPTRLEAPPRETNASSEGADLQFGIAREELGRGRDELLAFRDRLGTSLEPLEQECAPLLGWLPQPVHQFLHAGGWWLLIGVQVVLAGLWGRATVGRVRQLLASPPRPTARGKAGRGGRSSQRADLALLTEAAPVPGTHSVLVKGLPGRLRLLVLAPANREVGPLHPDMAETLLDWIRPGLGAAAAHDSPKTEIWERQYGKDGFPTTFFFQYRQPDAGRRSRWVLLAGSISAGREMVHVGLAVLTDEPNNIGQVRIQDEQWLDVLALRQ